MERQDMITFRKIVNIRLDEKACYKDLLKEWEAYKDQYDNMEQWINRTWVVCWWIEKKARLIVK